MITDLERKIVNRLKKHGCSDVPTRLIEQVVQGTIDMLPAIFDDSDGETPAFALDTREVTIEQLCENSHDWILCEDGTLVPVDDIYTDADGVSFHKDVWESFRNEELRNEA